MRKKDQSRKEEREKEQMRYGEKGWEERRIDKRKTKMKR
jgi:hypothetical protein